ncbi:MAG TPA: sugar phosphate isomerase/epimerase family protein [Armatimonadota bacterium]|jgi:inosose dehydratase
MKAAYHLINFGVWPDRSESDKLAAVRSVGYTGAESLEIDYFADPALLAERLAAHDLQLAAMTLPGRLLGQEDEELIALAHAEVKTGQAVGCDVSVVMVPRTNGRDIHTFGTTVDHYEEAARRLNLVGRILAEGGIRLCIHNHIDHMTESAEEMALLMENTDADAVSICFDTAHAVCGGNDPVEYARTFRDRIGYLHLKDARNTLHGRPYFFKNVFLPLGEGIIDFPSIFAILREIKYDNWYTVEMDSTFSNGDPVQEAATSLAYLRAHVG